MWYEWKAFILFRSNQNILTKRIKNLNENELKWNERNCYSKVDHLKNDENEWRKSKQQKL